MTDIKVGDLVKATRKNKPKESFTGSVVEVSASYVGTAEFGGYHSNWDFEVLERPLPPVEKELLVKATNEYRAYFGFRPDDTAVTHYGPAITAVINAVREFDRNKENNK